MNRPLDIITPDAAGTLAGLFRERVRRSPDSCAYRRFDRQGGCCECTSWAGTAALAARWQEALRREGLQPGDRVAVMLKNSLEWVLFDLAALGLGLVTVPLYVNDRPDNFAMIIEESGARLLLIEGVEHWERIRQVQGRLENLVRIVSLTRACTRECDLRLALLDEWLPDSAESYAAGNWPADALATIVYTSGTTGRPKGVMLSHANLLANAYAGISRVPVYPDDLFLSFLPLSHALERTAGYYVPIMAGGIGQRRGGQPPRERRQAPARGRGVHRCRQRTAGTGSPCDDRLLAQSGGQRSGHRPAGVAAHRRPGPHRRQRPHHHHRPSQGDHRPGHR
jgi:long-chain acyl-CoA synthetase